MSLIHIARNNAVLGQFTEDDVRAGLASGTYLATDLAWKTGHKDWLPLGQWTEFAAPGSVPPPIFMTEEAEMPAIPSWERRAELGTTRAFFKSLGEIVKSPNSTFSLMPIDGGLGGPLKFILISSITSSLLQAIIGGSIVAAGVQSEMIPPWLRSLGFIGAAAYYLLSGLIGAILSPFMYAGIIHLFLMIYKGANLGYEATFRACAYSTGAVSALCIPLTAMMLVPHIGKIALFVIMPIGLYSIALSCIAISRVQKTAPWRVVMAIITPGILCCCLYVAAAVALVGIYAGVKGAHP